MWRNQSEASLRAEETLIETITSESICLLVGVNKLWFAYTMFEKKKYYCRYNIWKADVNHLICCEQNGHKFCLIWASGRGVTDDLCDITKVSNVFIDFWFKYTSQI